VIHSRQIHRAYNSQDFCHGFKANFNTALTLQPIKTRVVIKFLSEILIDQQEFFFECSNLSCPLLPGQIGFYHHWPSPAIKVLEKNWPLMISVHMPCGKGTHKYPFNSLLTIQKAINFLQGWTKRSIIWVIPPYLKTLSKLFPIPYWIKLWKQISSIHSLFQSFFIETKE